MHSLIRECTITFNDLVEMRFDNYYLDFWAQFSIPAGKRNGYANMIGNVDDLTNPVAAGMSGQILPQAILNLPLPICHARDTGVALPTAALPYNDMRLNFNFRDWTELLILDCLPVQIPPPIVPVPAPLQAGLSVAATANDISGSAPQLSTCDVWAEYAIVSNDERKVMGQAGRDILIEQVQTVPTVSFNATQTQQQTDVRLSHAVKNFFFGIRNKTNTAEWANYTAASPVVFASGVSFSPDLSADPINTTSLMYENTQRLSNMGADYFALVNPWYNAVSMPAETGYHMYSYSLDMMNVNPMGSTNYGKLTNVSIQLTPSTAAQTSAASTGTLAAPNAVLLSQGAGLQQIFEMIFIATNHNIIRIAGGAETRVPPTVDCLYRCKTKRYKENSGRSCVEWWIQLYNLLVEKIVLGEIVKMLETPKTLTTTILSKDCIGTKRNGVGMVKRLKIYGQSAAKSRNLVLHQIQDAVQRLDGNRSKIFFFGIRYSPTIYRKISVGKCLTRISSPLGGFLYSSLSFLFLFSFLFSCFVFVFKNIFYGFFNP